MKQHWTFEKLAMATMPELEQILTQGTAPDAAQLVGLSYCGYNHEPIGRLTGVKFKKGFFNNGSGINGYNEQVKQDSSRFKGNWITKDASQMGYFRIRPLNHDTSKEFEKYRHLALFDYGIDQHRWHQAYFKLIRDIVALPNPGDHSLLLGKAYLQFSKTIKIFCCYFILGYPQPNHYPPEKTQRESAALEILERGEGLKWGLPQPMPALNANCKNCSNCLRCRM